MNTIKIAVTSDLHYGTLAQKEDLENYGSMLARKGVTHLAICGDLASRGFEHASFGEALSALSTFPGKILFTPGNHDLWTKEMDSFQVLTTHLPEMLSGRGFHLLDANPVVVGDIGIVGSVGWYDYSYTKVPAYLEELFSRYIFRFNSRDGEERLLRWNEIGNDEFQGKTCIVSADGSKWRKSTWQDKRYIHWDFTDESFLDYCIERLRKDIELIKDKVERILVLIHHLPFFDFVPDIPEPTWGFHRAFLGSGKMGEMLLNYPKVKYLFFGHSHRDTGARIGHIAAQNVFFWGYRGTYVIEGEE